MSHIDNLINTLSPHGIEFFTIESLFNLRNGYTPTKSNPDYWKGGSIPWFRMEDIRENGGVLDDALQHITESAVKGGRLFPANSLLVATSATIGEHALITVPHLSNQRFTSLSLKAPFSDKLDMKFVYYYGFVLNEWCRNNTTTSSFASVDMNGFKKFKFPVPPLEVQREIVSILDKFTELEAELEARQKQYSHYRDKQFESASPSDDWVELSEVASFRRGSSLQKKHLVNEGVPALHYGQVYTHYGVSAKATLSFVSEEFAKGKRFLNPGDVYIATTSENDEDLGKAVAWLGERPAVASNDAYIVETELDARFLSHYFASGHFHRQKGRFITGAKVRRLSAQALGNVLLPVPPLEVQCAIADNLDKFDALINDLTSGLPAEIAARRKQYEYYRDKLLAFKELRA